MTNCINCTCMTRKNVLSVGWGNKLQTVQILKRNRSVYFKKRINILGIINILQNMKEPIRSEKLLYKTMFRYKKSYMNYLDYCVDKELVTRHRIYGKKVHKVRESWFIITPKGRQFLEIVQ